MRVCRVLLSSGIAEFMVSEWDVFHYVQEKQYTQLIENPFTSCGFWSILGLRSMLLKEVSAMQ